MTELKRSWPEDREVPEIEESIDLTVEYQNVEDRYYTRYYFAQEEGQDQVVLLHSNRITLVALSPHHPVIKQKKIIKKLNFNVTENLNRLNNKGKIQIPERNF